MNQSTPIPVFLSFSYKVSDTEITEVLAINAVTRYVIYDGVIKVFFLDGASEMYTGERQKKLLTQLKKVLTILPELK